MAPGADAEIVSGLRNVQFGEELALHGIVVVLPGVQDVFDNLRRV